MDMNFAQFVVRGSSSQHLAFQQFIIVWTGVTDFNEIMERRRDDTRYFEVEDKNGLFIETYFTEEESLLLMKKYPKDFSILVQG
jgi:hypothetical protein